MEQYIGGKYRLFQKLGNGAFGDIFYGSSRSNGALGIEVKTGEEVAIKLV